MKVDALLRPARGEDFPRPLQRVVRDLMSAEVAALLHDTGEVEVATPLLE